MPERPGHFTFHAHHMGTGQGKIIVIKMIIPVQTLPSGSRWVDVKRACIQAPDRSQKYVSIRQAKPELLFAFIFSP